VGELDGKVALVTGAGSGIGHAIATRFGREGALVAVNYFGHAEEAKRLARELEACCTRSLAHEADVSRRDQVHQMIARVVDELGPVDVLVNNAGFGEAAPFLEIDEESWDRVLSVDLTGAFFCAQACAAVMKESGGGSIVNISSIHEDLPFEGYTSYCAAKGGMRMLMRNAAVELARFGIRVNNIAPGPIAVERTEPLRDDPERAEVLRRAVPLGRMGEPEEVAEVALFLASQRASYVTGSTYYVDGGMLRHTEPV
jgi:glucose 1-dehydrogenase